MFPTVFTNFRAIGSRMSVVGVLVAAAWLPLVAQINPSQVAILKWYGANKATSFAAQTGPYGMAFDGVNMWVANSQSNSLSRYRVSDGYNLGNVALGHSAQLLAYDGSSIWASDGATGKVTKIRPSDGAILFEKTLSSTGGLIGLAFDGATMWAATGGGIIAQLRISDGVSLSGWYVGCQAQYLAFDGGNIWGSCTSTHQITKQPVSGGNYTAQTVGNWPIYMAFDGAYMWVGNNGSTNTIQKLRQTDMAIMGTFIVTNTGVPTGMVFDGTNIWAGTSVNTLVKVRPSDGAVLGTYTASGSYPLGLAFDGANVWASNYSSGTVSKY